MRYSDDFIEKVRAGNRIEDVVGGYVALQKKGTSLMGLCPFHNERTPSFSVRPSRGTYHCFGCGAGGDVFNFLMEYDKLSFSEAIAALAERAGIPLPSDTLNEEVKTENSERSRLFDLHKEAAMFYFRVLKSPAGKHAVSYLTNRGLSEETIRKFGLGYAPKTQSGLYVYLKEKGFSDALLKNSGLFIYKSGNREVGEKFWNRIMFPIMDVRQRVIGFGGRVMGDAKPKYLNSPETKLFDKSRNLYGLYAAKKSKRKYIILCEGYMDVISLHQAGFTNAAASLGTALTSRQSALLGRYTRDVLLLYDNDEAGIKAAQRAVRLLREAGINSKVADLRPYKDPDEFLKAAGSAMLEKKIEDAENGFMFEIRLLFESGDMHDPQVFSDFQHETARMLLYSFSDEIERNSYLSEVARKYALDPGALKRQISKLAVSSLPPAQLLPSEARPPGKRTKSTAGERAQKIMLCWLCQKPGLLDELTPALYAEDFAPGMPRMIFEELQKLRKSKNFTPVSILNRFEESTDKTEAAEIIEGEDLPEDALKMSKAVKEVLSVIKTESLSRRLENVSPMDMSALQKMAEERKQLEKLKKEISKISG